LASLYDTIGVQTLALILFAGSVRLCTLEQTDIDWPRMYYDFEPSPEFEAFREVLDLRGSNHASQEAMEAGETLDLRVINEEGACVRLKFIFLDGNKAVIRQGLVRDES
jgi:hypothetical protein